MTERERSHGGPPPGCKQMNLWVPVDEFRMVKMLAVARGRLLRMEIAEALREHVELHRADLNPVPGQQQEAS